MGQCLFLQLFKPVCISPHSSQVIVCIPSEWVLQLIIELYNWVWILLCYNHAVIVMVATISVPAEKVLAASKVSNIA